MTALVVAAHPDDEVIGAGIWMHRHSGHALYIVHVTDGSPRDMRDARAHGFPTGEAYAAARREELAEALGMIPVPPENCLQLDIPDQEAYLHLGAIVERLGHLIQALQPDLVLSHAYEGGHPDHDSAAFAVAAVHKRHPCFEHREFPLYHADAAGAKLTGSFIERPQGKTEALKLSSSEQELKLKMFQCFRTQREILEWFNIDREMFRAAPSYDFTKSPHPGPLLYERWGWGISGAQWRDQASKTLQTSG